MFWSWFLHSHKHSHSVYCYASYTPIFLCTPIKSLKLSFAISITVLSVAGKGLVALTVAMLVAVVFYSLPQYFAACTENKFQLISSKESDRMVSAHGQRMKYCRFPFTRMVIEIEAKSQYLIKLLKIIPAPRLAHILLRNSSTRYAYTISVWHHFGIALFVQNPSISQSVHVPWIVIDCALMDEQIFLPRLLLLLFVHVLIKALSKQAAMWFV